MTVFAPSISALAWAGISATYVTQLGEAVMPSNTTHVTLALDGHTEDGSVCGKWSGSQMLRRNGMNNAGGR
ncbi:hypothetical protein EDB85DRAFT_329011 [Lactarius pseudohatsudake]|nr:hypothetical protein EDB85DRAFT_329011 [Lactarius pseudohatsudake]